MVCNSVMISRVARLGSTGALAQQFVRIRLAARVTEWLLVVTGQARRASVNITNPGQWRHRTGTCYKFNRLLLLATWQRDRRLAAVAIVATVLAARVLFHYVAFRFEVGLWDMGRMVTNIFTPRSEWNLTK